MTFLQPLALYGLPLVLLPIIIHLINRFRHRPQPWGAMRFLVTASRSSMGRVRLRQFLILLCRVMAVLLLVLFVARPLAGGWLGWAMASAPDAILILLDRSPSMELQPVGATQSKREQSLSLLSGAYGELGGVSQLVLVESALRSPQTLGDSALLQDLSLTAASDASADVPAMLISAVHWLTDNQSGASEIWIASDLQRSNWHPDDPRWEGVQAQLRALPQPVRVRVLALPEPGGANRSITLHQVRRGQEAGSHQARFVLDLQAGPTSEMESEEGGIPLIQVLNGARSQLEVKMDGPSLRWRHAVPLQDDPASSWGRFELPADANPSDNAAYFVVGAAQPLRAGLLATDAAAGGYLELMIRALQGGSVEAVERLIIGELAPDALEDKGLVIWQAALPSGEMAEVLDRFVAEGGAILFLPPGESGPARLGGLGWGLVEESKGEEFFFVSHWDESQGPLAKTEQGFSLPLGAIEIQKRQSIQGAGTVLAGFEDGTPFLVRKAIGRGQVFFCSSLPTPGWSSLADGPVMLPMLQRLLDEGAERLQGSRVVVCGELGPVELEARWENLDGTAKDIRTQAGVYRSGDRLLAVNRPGTEDDPERVTEEELEALFSGLPFRMWVEQGGIEEALQGEIWRAFLLAMLLFLLGESALVLPPKTSGVVRGRPSAAASRPREKVAEAVA